jgi:hypothetical protein
MLALDVIDTSEGRASMSAPSDDSVVPARPPVLVAVAV